jgi:hypothetical protein
MINKMKKALSKELDELNKSQWLTLAFYIF